ncbi:polysaccharide deacetylase family protein [Paenibacillus spiritus]|uniref:Polysaccharide deacetylase family protein n=1 Tax=Paenibacillus spiritus TaxID=2496557 RepID=A0A5J5GB78_9BACL|nr:MULTISPECIES: polysaccharide deacetylase family protein [Paenibacillus]KAA9005369.1 polysaccharide deacetylase family protein [Paenibacillus spiritus]
METLLLWLFYITTFYAFIPGLITRIFGYRVFRRGVGVKDYALTFDDGPDPEYTPRLLDLLKEHDAKATFFVVGAHAERHPELIRRMHDEGHLIGIHNYVHKSNWIMRPGTVRKQIQRTDDIIHSITGQRSIYYRPPWGIVNLFDFSKRRQVRIILWSAMFGDWKEKLGAKKLTAKLLSRLNPGEVMLLHDCGRTLGADPKAPANMLTALKTMLEEADKRGLKSIRVDEMIRASEKAREGRLSFGKMLLVWCWLMWEKAFQFMFRLKTVSPENPFFHYRLRSYSGDTIEMGEGSVLKKGDRIVELHFDNRRLFELGVSSRSEAQLAIRMIRYTQKELPDLAEIIASSEELASAKALYGVSMINRGPEKFGFLVTDLPDGLFAKSTRVYLRILLSVIHPSGGNRLKRRADALVPKTMLMPITDLLRSYGKPHPGSLTKSVKHSEEDAELSVTLSDADLPGVHAVH